MRTSAICTRVSTICDTSTAKNIVFVTEQVPDAARVTIATATMAADARVALNTVQTGGVQAIGARSSINGFPSLRTIGD